MPFSLIIDFEGDGAHLEQPRAGRAATDVCRTTL